MSAVFYILLGWLVTVFGCYCAGALALHRLRPSLWTREESVALRFVTGAGIYATAVFFLGIAHLYYRAAFFLLPALFAVAAWRTGALPLPVERLPALPTLWRRLPWIALPFGILYLSNAMAPEASPDGSAYHLGLVAKYYRERAMVPVTSNMYAALSQGMEMLFLSAFSIGRHSAAALVHFTYLLALPWLLICFGRRYAMPAAGVTAALLVFLSPVVGIDGISAYLDVAAATQWFAVFLVVRRLDDEPAGLSLPILAGILGGFAYGLKYTLAPALVFAALRLVWLPRKSAVKPLLALSAAALPFVAPWVIRNIIWWHNPLAPFFNHWFPNPFVQYGFELEYRRHMAIYSLQSYSQIPLEVTVNGANLNGLLGPVFLLTPLALLALRHPEGRRLLLAAAFALATYPSNIGTRFLIPALPFLAFSVALVLSSVRWLPIAVVAVHAVLSWPDVIPSYASQWAWRLEKVTWREALRLRPEDAFIIHHLPSYGITRKIETFVPPGRRIFGFGQIPEAYTNRDYLVSFQSSEGLAIRDILTTAFDRDRQPTIQLKLLVPPSRRHSLRIVQDRLDAETRWSISELRISSSGKELPRTLQWRLRSNTTRHEVQNAFDGSYLTRWLTERSRLPGMYLEVDFGRYEVFDEITVFMSPDQPWDTYHIEAPNENGVWEPLKTELRPTNVTAPIGLRRRAVEELLHRNIHYIVSADSDHLSGDFLLNRAVWGLEELANVADVRLYRLVPAAEFESRPKESR